MESEISSDYSNFPIKSKARRTTEATTPNHYSNCE